MISLVFVLQNDHLRVDDQLNMRYQYNFLLIALLLLAFSACGDRLGVRNGVYTGQFTVDYPAPMDTTVTGPAHLEFDHGKFVSKGVANYYPGYSEGSFTVTADSITFVSTVAYTADHDGNVHLNGTYAYTVDHKRLKIWYKHHNANWTYTYDVERE